MYCADCQVAFCQTHFEVLHVHEPLPDPEFANHVWSLCQYEKVRLAMHICPSKVEFVLHHWR